MIEVFYFCNQNLFGVKKNMFVLAFCLIVLAFSSCSSLRNTTPKNLPPLSEVSPILDSIVEEGYQLYYSERANWIATDLVFERYGMDELGRSITYQADNNLWTVCFFDKNNEKCLLECRFDIKSGNTVTLDSIRPISTFEKEQLQRKETMLNEAISKYGSELKFAPETFGNPNIDFVRMNDHLTRVYFLQGTIRHDVIPFGNDYSIDFDENLKPIAFRRYHRSLIDSPTKNDKGEEAKFLFHTHLKDNPFITPTDICNFLLYRPKNMDGFMVASEAYNCMFMFSVNQHRIVVQ